jgi:hypothetical protein
MEVTMRMSFEVLSGEVETREFSNRKTGELEKVSVLLMHGIDTDFPSSLYKIQIWREFEKAKDCTIRGTIVELKFNAIKPADGRFEKVPVISVVQDNLRIIKSAEQALRELQQRIASQTQTKAA